MATNIQQTLWNPSYRNWVKSGLALKVTKDGIQCFVDDQNQIIHQGMLASIRRAKGLPAGTVCSTCTTQNVIPCPTRGVCSVRRGVCNYHDNGDPLKKYTPCPNGICDAIYHRVVNSHRFNGPSWLNTDAQLWCSNSWAVAKCFMPRTGYEHVNTAAETDITGLVSVVINLSDFQNIVTDDLSQPNNLFCQVRNIRNAIMHTSTFELSTADLNSYIDTMILLVSDPGLLATYLNAKNAITKLNQIKTDSVTMTTEDETKIRDEALRAIDDIKREAIQALKDEGSEQIEHIENKKEETIQALKDEGSEQIEHIEKKKEETIQALKDEGSEQIEHIEKKKEETIQALKDEGSVQLQTLKDEGNEQIEHTDKKKEETIQALKDEGSVQLQALKDQGSEHIVHIEKKKEETIQAVDTKKEETIQALKRKSSEQIVHMDEHMKQNIKKMKTEGSEQIERIKQTTNKMKEETVLAVNEQGSKHLERMEQKAKQIKEDLHAEVSQVKYCDDTYLEQKKSLQKELIQIYMDKYVKTSVCPQAPEEEDTDIADIFVTPSMRLVDPQQRQKGGNSQNKTIESFKDMFFKDSHLCKNIYVTGDAGTGKTTLCKRLISTWCNAHSKSTTSDQLSDNEVYHSKPTTSDQLSDNEVNHSKPTTSDQLSDNEVNHSKLTISDQLSDNEVSHSKLTTSDQLSDNEVNHSKPTISDQLSDNEVSHSKLTTSDQLSDNEVNHSKPTTSDQLSDNEVNHSKPTTSDQLSDNESNHSKPTTSDQLSDNELYSSDDESFSEYISEQTWNLFGDKEFKDEHIMMNFQFLFYISLRHAVLDSQINNMIENQLLPTSYHKKLLSHILENEPERCLIILDGLDEWSLPKGYHQSLPYITDGLPSRTIANIKCSILTTTRPWKLEVLRLRPSEIDLQIQLLGLDEVASSKLIKLVVDILNTRDGQRKQPEKFERELQNKQLEQLQTIPVILKQLICLWHEGKPLEESQCTIFSGMINLLFELAKKHRIEIPELAKITENLPKTPLPKCFDDAAECQTFSSLLYSLSRLAFETLFRMNAESSLVFESAKASMFGLETVEIEFFLKVGILTQSKVTIGCTPKKSLSFLHKTFQEFLASVFVSMSSDKCKLVKTICCICNSVDKALEMSKVFLFISGMSPQLVNRLYKHIWKVASDITQDYRQHSDRLMYPSGTIIMIHDNMIRCVKESSDNGYKNIKLKLEDIFIHRNTPNIATEYPIHLIGTNIGNIKSVNFSVDASIPSDLTDLVTQVASLQYLHISRSLLGFMNMMKNIHITTIMSNSKDTLITLILSYIEVKTLDFTILNKLKNLRVLIMSDITLTHSQFAYLVTYVSHATQLQRIQICNIKIACNSTSYPSNLLPEQPASLDLSNHQQLHYLELCRIPNTDIVSVNTTKLHRCEISTEMLPSLSECLTVAPSLQEISIQVEERRNEYKDLSDLLVKTLSNLEHLKKIDICSIDFSETILQLSHKMKHLESVKISSGIMTSRTLHSFLDSIPDTQHSVNVEIDLLKIIPMGDANKLSVYIKSCPRFVVTKNIYCLGFCGLLTITFHTR